MEFTDVIRGRESIRSYDPERPVERAVLERILDAGRIAPSAHNNQPWRFLVVQSREILAKVKPCFVRPWFTDAPCVLAVVGKLGDAWVRSYDGYNSIETDLAIAMDHMILAAENEGVGACWIAFFDPAILRPALGLASDEKVFAITPLGYPRAGFAKKGQKNRKALSEVVKYL